MLVVLTQESSSHAEDSDKEPSQTERSEDDASGVVKSTQEVAHEEAHDVVEVLVEEEDQVEDGEPCVSFFTPFQFHHCCHSSCVHHPNSAQGLLAVVEDSSSASSRNSPLSNLPSSATSTCSRLAFWSI